METDEIIIQAKIAAVKSSVEHYAVVRDRKSENKVCRELREQLKMEGTLGKISDADFQKRYRACLRNYAPYVHGRYVPEDMEDGKPGILVARRIWDHELLLRYSVGKNSYTKTVNYSTETKVLVKDQVFYITVTEREPKRVLKMSDWDYRPQAQENCSGAVVLLVAAFLPVLAYTSFG